jgi:hypothetical protein
MRFGTSELDGFTTSVIEDDHQIKNAANEYHSAHYDLCEVVKWGGVLFLLLCEQTDAFISVVVFASASHPAKLSLVPSTDEIRWDEKAGLRRDAVYAPKLSTCSKHR